MICPQSPAHPISDLEVTHFCPEALLAPTGHGSAIAPRIECTVWYRNARGKAAYADRRLQLLKEESADELIARVLASTTPFVRSTCLRLAVSRPLGPKSHRTPGGLINIHEWQEYTGGELVLTAEAEQACTADTEAA